MYQKYYHGGMSNNKKTIVKIFHDEFKQKIDIEKKINKNKKNRILISVTSLYFKNNIKFSFEI